MPTACSARERICSAHGTAAISNMGRKDGKEPGSMSRNNSTRRWVLVVGLVCYAFFVRLGGGGRGAFFLLIYGIIEYD